MSLFAAPGFGVAEETVICCGMPCFGWLGTLVAAGIGCAFRSKAATRISVMLAAFVGCIVVYTMTREQFPRDDPFPDRIVWRMFGWWLVSLIPTSIAVMRSFFGSPLSSENRQTP